MRFLVIQRGARRGYAIPKLLAEAGMLERFYTDLAGNRGAGRLLTLGRFLPGGKQRLDRLAKRSLPSGIAPQSLTFAGPAFRHAMRQRLGLPGPEADFARLVALTADWSRAMIHRGFGQATHVYSMLNEAGSVIDEARRRGLTVVSEVYILLSTERIVAAEQRHFPEWEPGTPDYDALRARFLPGDIYPRDIDLCICPSEAVRDDLISNWGVDHGKTALVPYGMDPRWLDLEPRPERGRILFVGTADLRKGIHYLAAAANRLLAAGRKYEFRVAGNVTDTVRRHPECRNLTFLGRVPRDRIHEEFQRADLFVLPSLAEGSAEVTYEALAAGVPQVVTPATGSVARDRIEGRVVPERDPEALAAAIEASIEDRSWRDAAGAASRERAREYTWEEYGERLIEALSAFQSNSR